MLRRGFVAGVRAGDWRALQRAPDGRDSDYEATQAELEELVQAMQRRGEQLARLKRTHRVRR